jgi:hypothetical protein
MRDDRVTICQVASCMNPSDGWIVCRSCGDTFVRTLADTAWLLEELDTVITQQARYVSQSAGKSSETPMPFDVKAAETRAYLMGEIATSVRLIEDANGWTTTASTEVGAAAWLAHSVSAVRLHPLGGIIIDSVMRWYAAAIWAIDRPAQRQYLGECGTDPDGVACGGRIYGKAGKPEATCDTCGGIYQADELRAHLLKELDDKVCTAAEIAKLTTYLALDIDRTQVRKRINQWHTRNRIEAKRIDEDGTPSFRFGDALAMLHRDTKKRAG